MFVTSTAEPMTRMTPIISAGSRSLAARTASWPIPGQAKICSVITAPDHGGQRAALVLRALRPMLYQALMRVLLPESVFPTLSQREVAILECLASGHNDTQIADALSISASTVRFHLGNVFEKLGARNRCHAVAIGFQSGLLQR